MNILHLLNINVPFEKPVPDVDSQMEEEDLDADFQPVDGPVDEPKDIQGNFDEDDDEDLVVIH